MAENMHYNSDKTTLTFSFYFNEPIDNFEFSENLRTIIFGYSFNQNIDNVKLPNFLITIVFDCCFSHRIDKVKFPDSLESIVMKNHYPYIDSYLGPNLSSKKILCTDVGMTIQLKNKLSIDTENMDNFCIGDNVSNDLSMYTSLKNLTVTVEYYYSWKFSTTNLVLPQSLETITFGKNFNVRIDYIRFYNNLHTIIFGDSFNQSLENVSFPPSIKNITFGIAFNMSLNEVKLPVNLETLKFGKNFNQSLDKVFFGNSLQSIIFGEKFNQSLDKVLFPESLQWIAFGYEYNQSLDNLPQTLKKLSFSQIYSDLTNTPFSLELIEIEVFYYNSSLKKIKKIPNGCEIVKWY